MANYCTPSFHSALLRILMSNDLMKEKRFTLNGFRWYKVHVIYWNWSYWCSSSFVSERLSFSAVNAYFFHFYFHNFFLYIQYVSVGFWRSLYLVSSVNLSTNFVDFALYCIVLVLWAVKCSHPTCLVVNIKVCMYNLIFCSISICIKFFILIFQGYLWNLINVRYEWGSDSSACPVILNHSII